MEMFFVYLVLLVVGILLSLIFDYGLFLYIAIGLIIVIFFIRVDKDKGLFFYREKSELSDNKEEEGGEENG